TGAGWLAPRRRRPPPTSWSAPASCGPPHPDSHGTRRVLPEGDADQFGSPGHAFRQRGQQIAVDDGGKVLPGRLDNVERLDLVDEAVDVALGLGVHQVRN